MSFLSSITNPSSIVTAIDDAIRFPEILDVCQTKYKADIDLYKSLIAEADSSAHLLERIRSTSFSADQRMSLLKMFRRSVSPVIDTEMAKKIKKVPTSDLVESLGYTFKDIALLKAQFSAITKDQEASLAALIGEYDTRGQLGYKLTDLFFTWFEKNLQNKFQIRGPRGAGPDIELSTVFPEFSGSYPCDFVITSSCGNVVAVGFARYDSTRGGAQSDDRTGGNSDKVTKAKLFCQSTGKSFKLIFLADGPGLAHRDTWEEACRLDGSWDGAVRVTTMKTASERITADWLTA